MGQTTTPTQRLAGILLGQPPEQWIAERRTAGDSWRKIATDLRERTGGQIDVTAMTLINWTKGPAA